MFITDWFSRKLSMNNYRGNRSSDIGKWTVSASFPSDTSRNTEKGRFKRTIEFVESWAAKFVPELLEKARNHPPQESTLAYTGKLQAQLQVYDELSRGCVKHLSRLCKAMKEAKASEASKAPAAKAPRKQAKPSVCAIDNRLAGLIKNNIDLLMEPDGTGMDVDGEEEWEDEFR